MLTNGVPNAGNGRPKGKAVEIHHHLFDALWNAGNRQIDASILVPSLVANAPEQTNEEEAKTTEQDATQAASNENNVEGDNLNSGAGADEEESKFTAEATDFYSAFQQEDGEEETKEE